MRRKRQRLIDAACTLAVLARGGMVAGQCFEYDDATCCDVFSSGQICQDGSACYDWRLSGSATTIRVVVGPGQHRMGQPFQAGGCMYSNYGCDGANGCVYIGSYEQSCQSFARGAKCVGPPDQ